MRLGHRVFSSFFALLFLLCALPAPSLAAEGEQPQKTVRVGFFFSDGYHNVDADGRRSGYGYEYLARMLPYTNWEYEFVGHDKSWAELQNMLESGEIDLLTGAEMTPSRLDRFDFSERPIGVSSSILTVRAGDERLLTGDYHDWNGMRVGMIRGDSRNESFECFMAGHGFSATKVFYDDEAALVRALKSGRRIDAAVTSSLRAVHGEWVLESFDASPFYVMVRKGDAALLMQVNKALEQLAAISPNLEIELRQKYYTVEPGEEIAFTPEERHFIASAAASEKSFTVLVCPDRQPLTYLENGEPRGIMVELAQTVFARAGLSVAYICPETRSDYYKLRLAGDYAVCLDSYADYGAAEDYGLLLTEPYITCTVSRLTRTHSASPLRTVAAVRGANITQFYVSKLYENDRVLYYDSVTDCVEAVRRGYADMVFLYSRVAQYYVTKDERTSLTADVVYGRQVPFALGVSSREDRLLASVLNKGVLSLSQETIDTVINRQMEAITRPDTLLARFYSNPQLVLLVLFLLFTVLLCLALYFSALRRKREVERFIQYVCRANDAVLEIDFAAKTCVRFLLENGRVAAEKEPFLFHRDFLSRVHPDDLEVVNTLLGGDSLPESGLAGGEIYFECRMLVPNGQYEWFSFALSPILPARPGRVQAMVFERNINAVKLDEMHKREALSDALKTARTASEAKGMFLSRMSHEMRTPLNAVIGYTQIARTAFADYTSSKAPSASGKLTGSLDKLMLASKQLLSIINDVLDISSIESGRMMLARENFDISELLENTSALFSTQCAEKNVAFFAPDVALLSHRILLGDPLRVTQVLNNILGNAVKFTPAGGSIHFLVDEPMAKDGIAYLSFVISDTGVGMTRDCLDNLFEPFRQQDATTASKYGGSGLGMSIVKNLVSMMHGSVYVDSTYGAGTNVRVEIPFEIGEAAPAQAESVPETAAFSGQHLLLAEDNEMNREIAFEILSSVGFSIDTAENGRLALERFLASKPGFYAAVLMDVQMPEMNGYEATRAIRASARPDAAEIPILAMTANAFADDVAASLSAGMNGHIAKPINVPELLSALADAIKKYRNGGNQS